MCTCFYSFLFKSSWRCPKTVVSAGAKAIGISRPNFYLLLNERAAASPEMAIRLSRAFERAARPG